MPEHAPDWSMLADRIGQLFDDIVFPMLAAWLIYILKSALVAFTARFRPPDKRP